MTNHRKLSSQGWEIVQTFRQTDWSLRSAFSILRVTALVVSILPFAHQPSFAQNSDPDEGVKDCTDPNQPCFANNPDILSGRRHLLRTDDLALSIDREPGNGSSQFDNYLLNTSDLRVTKQTTYDIVNPSCTIESPVPAPISTQVGRVFNLKNDVVVTLAPKDEATGTNCGSGVGELSIYIHDPIDNATNDSITALGFKPDFTRMVMDDFDLDGYADIVLIGPFFNATFTLMEVYSARDVDDPSGGMLFKKSLNLGEVDSPRVPRAEPVTGDFNGDGAVDVAWLGAEDEGEPLSIYFASICPTAGFEIVNTTCSEAFEIVLSTQVISTGVNWSPLSPDTFQAQLTAGDFDGTTSSVAVDDELLFLRKTDLQSDSAKLLVEAFNFTADLSAVKAPESLIFEPVKDGMFFNLPTSLFHVASGRLDSGASREQAVIGASAFPNVPISLYGICPITFSTSNGNDLAMTSHCLHGEEDTVLTMYGLTIGRFYPPDVDGQIDFNQQIAILLTENSPAEGPNTRVDIYTVKPTALSDPFVPAFHSEHTIADEVLLSFEHRVHAPLQAGDLQGNSLVLGEPDIVKVSGHIEPGIVLGVPPMHADFIRKQPGDPTSLVNVSIDPANGSSTSEEADFDATYKFSSSSDTTTTHQSKTSSTLSTKESVQAKVSFEAAGNGISASTKDSAKQFSSKVVSDTHVFKKSITSKTQASTGLGDLVWFSVKDFYIYIYPVIGRTVCPDNQATCAEADRMPMQIQFSGPDDIKTNITSAASDLMVMQGHNMEWYQPVHEPGNLLSYPWNEALLKDRLATRNPKAPTPQELAKSASETLEGAAFINETTWTDSTSSDQSTGSTQKFTENASVSVAAKTSFLFGIGKASVTASFDIKGSDSTQTLTTAVSTVASSEGIDVTVPNFDNPNTWALPDFEYSLQTFIFGEQVPEGTLDDDKAPADISTNGTQRTGYVALATDSNWFDAYNLPDLALNHPARWTWDDTSLVASFNRPNKVAVDASRFYAMRGFFVTPQDATGVSPVGPMLTQLTAGEELTIWTRIYNLSLTPFDATDTAKVQIFGQVFDATSPSCQQVTPPDNCQFVGPSFEVGTQSLDASLLNAYPDATAETNDDPNWLLVKQDWNTEPDADQPLWGCGPVGSKVTCADKELVFWVLVWAERDGALVPEMLGHGLAAIPSSSLDNIVDVPLETVTLQGESRTFSNNVGLYNQTFYVCETATECDPPNTVLEATAATNAASAVALAAAATEKMEGDLIIDDITFERETVKLHDSVRVDTRIATTDLPFSPLNIFYYDGDPADEGRIPFDHEYIPFIGSNREYVNSSRFVPQTCGPHEIHVVVAAVGGEPLSDYRYIEVTIDPASEIDRMIRQVKQSDLPYRLKRKLVRKLWVAKKMFWRGYNYYGHHILQRFASKVSRLGDRGRIPTSRAQSFVAQVDRLADCLR